MVELRLDRAAYIVLVRLSISIISPIRYRSGVSSGRKMKESFKQVTKIEEQELLQSYALSRVQVRLRLKVLKSLNLPGPLHQGLKTVSKKL